MGDVAELQLDDLHVLKELNLLDSLERMGVVHAKEYLRKSIMLRYRLTTMSPVTCGEVERIWMLLVRATRNDPRAMKRILRNLEKQGRTTREETPRVHVKVSEVDPEEEKRVAQAISEKAREKLPPRPVFFLFFWVCVMLFLVAVVAFLVMWAL